MRRTHGSEGAGAQQWAPATRLYAKYGIPPVLLVVCQDKSTAAWASTPVHIGPPPWQSLTLRPLVLGPHNVPVITDPARAARDVPLATLSAITHAREPGATGILEALASAMKTLDEDTASVFAELTELGLGNAPAARTWRNLMAVDLSFFRSETSQRLRAEGRAQDVILLLETRGITVTDETRQRITDCHDFNVLGTWFRRAVTANSADQLFADD